MNNLREIFTGILIITTLQDENTSVKAQPTCNYHTSGDTVIADCKKKGITSIPHDVPVDVTSLDISENKIKKLTSYDFSKYRHLDQLTMTDLVSPTPNKSIPIASDTLYSLTSLRKLVMCNSALKKPAEKFKWPKNLRSLLVSGIQGWEFDLSEVPLLEELHAKNCNLRRLPKFSITAPLIEIDLNTNPLDNITVEDIARYCKLRYLRINLNYTMPNGIESGKLIDGDKEHHCMCYRLRVWLDLKKIEGAGALNCNSSATIFPQTDLLNSTKECDTLFEIASKFYNHCIENQSRRSTIEYFIYGFLIILFLPILVFLWKTWRVYRSPARRNYRESAESDSIIKGSRFTSSDL